ncbi:Protein of unknown function [Gracilibacillus orientalis]|uniref:DUF2515 domain-containing protein n=1 Tax=Gracilibacillus orientalis TaxID=334253 RepID=A0A1I4KNV1_9BACI|nr:DUF2515 domain-containing protein [Gracilibacillus orientalis]SFL80425.1 Protein of unknown function [Gracilibacillus orientalis]
MSTVINIKKGGSQIFDQFKRLPTELKTIKKELQKKEQAVTDLDNLSDHEVELIKAIKEQTRKYNINNVTRTQAYMDFFKKHPDIEWAFLAHMVARNAGWNMTDLKGSLLTRLMTQEQQEYFFAFLERSNWLIFHDAFPQLLLYEESIRKKKNLFYLLPQFGVSFFMKVMWDYYYQTKDKNMISVALIINEQNYIEDRVIQNKDYQANLLESLEFKIQELLQLNQILFPFSDRKQVKLIGQSVHQFASLKDRILLGKRLYQLLFDDEFFDAIYEMALQQRHTGSRKDYWPNIFNNINEANPDQPFQESLKECQLKPGANRLYSPTLEQAWRNVEQKPAEQGDWYSDWKVIHYLRKDPSKINGAIYGEYCESLEKMELAILAKGTMSK